jgi:hypothetical protein
MANTMTLISSVTVLGATSASMDFNSIPATFTDLCLKVSARTDRANVTDQLKITFNGSSSGYTGIILYGTGSSALSETNASATGGSTYLIGEYIDGNNATASTFSNGELYIPNYAGSTYKSINMDLVEETNATAANVSLTAGLWSNTSAITSIKLQSANGFNFLQYSTAYLYGVNNA